MNWIWHRTAVLGTPGIALIIQRAPTMVQSILRWGHTFLISNKTIHCTRAWRGISRSKSTAAVGKMEEELVLNCFVFSKIQNWNIFLLLQRKSGLTKKKLFFFQNQRSTHCIRDCQLVIVSYYFQIRCFSWGSFNWRVVVVLDLSIHHQKCISWFAFVSAGGFPRAGSW